MAVNRGHQVVPAMRRKANTIRLDQNGSIYHFFDFFLLLNSLTYTTFCGTNNKIWLPGIDLFKIRPPVFWYQKELNFSKNGLFGQHYLSFRGFSIELIILSVCTNLCQFYHKYLIVIFNQQHCLKFFLIKSCICKYFLMK